MNGKETITKNVQSIGRGIGEKGANHPKQEN